MCCEERLICTPVSMSPSNKTSSLKHLKRIINPFQNICQFGLFILTLQIKLVVKSRHENYFYPEEKKTITYKPILQS